MYRKYELNVLLRSEGEGWYPNQLQNGNTRLFDEILQNQRNCIQILTASVAATGVILGFSVANKDGYLCLIPLIVLLPALYIFISQMKSTFRIAAYIRLFIEGKEKELQYESRWAEIRITRGNKKGIYTSNTLRIFHGLGFVCLLFSMTYWRGLAVLLAIVVCLFIAHVVHSSMLMNQAVDPKRHAKFWESEKKE